LKENPLLSGLEGNGDERQVGAEINSPLDFKYTKRDMRVLDECDPQLAELRKAYSDLDATMTASAPKLISSLASHSGISSLSILCVPHEGFLPNGFTFGFETETHICCKNVEMTCLESVVGTIAGRRRTERSGLEVLSHPDAHL
jgi:hypothetical protein